MTRSVRYIAALSSRTAATVAAALLTALAVHPPSIAAGKPVWSAAPSTAIVQEETTFSSAGSRLSGTLHLPRDGESLGAVVVTHAASLPLREQPLYRHLTEMLPPLGIAVLVYDRRGSGRSGGDLKASDYTLLADDAIAAVRAVGRHPRIDPERVGIWGLSQGGWIALLAASRAPDVAFAVSISAPMVTPDLQMIFLTQNILRVNGYPEDDVAQAVATRKAVDDYMRGEIDRATAQRAVDAAKHKPWFKLTYMGESFQDRATSRWRKEIEHDPVRTLEKVEVPVLMLYGAADPVVPVATSVKHLEAVADRHADLELAVIAGADHHMETSTDPKMQLDQDRFDEKPEAPEYFAILANWLTRHGIALGRQGR